MAQPLPVHVIHDPSLVERAVALQRALDDLGWTATWIVTPEPRARGYASGRISPRLSRAQASVYLKQLEAFRRIAEAPDPRALILEDDPIFPEDFGETFAAYLMALPADAGSVFFGSSCGHEAPAMAGNARYALVDRTRSLSAYLVTRDWAATVHRELSQAPMTQPIDLAVDSVIRRLALPTYWSVPALVENGSESGRFRRTVTKGAWRSHPLVQWLARR